MPMVMQMRSPMMDRKFEAPPLPLLKERRERMPSLLRKGSFHQWIGEEVKKDDAVRLIQSFVRAKLKLHGSAEKEGGNSLVKSLGDSVASTAPSSSEELEEEEEHQQLEVFLWHGNSLGLEFDSCPITGYPRVIDDTNSNDSLPGMWNVRNGDFLISVNDSSTHCSYMSINQVVQIVEGGVRPAILRFRRPGANEMQKNIMTRSRRMTSTVRQDQHKRRERLERSLSYIIWREEDATLGIGLKPDRTKPYPVVSEISEFGAVGQQAVRSPVSVGDLLLSINHLDVSQLGCKKAVELLQFAPRPLVLTFRRTVQEQEGARCLDL